MKQKSCNFYLICQTVLINVTSPDSQHNILQIFTFKIVGCASTLPCFYATVFLKFTTLIWGRLHCSFAISSRVRFLTSARDAIQPWCCNEDTRSDIEMEAAIKNKWNHGWLSGDGEEASHWANKHHWCEQSKTWAGVWGTGFECQIPVRAFSSQQSWIWPTSCPKYRFGKRYMSTYQWKIFLKFNSDSKNKQLLLQFRMY